MNSSHGYHTSHGFNTSHGINTSSGINTSHGVNAHSGSVLLQTNVCECNKLTEPAQHLCVCCAGYGVQKNFTQGISSNGVVSTGVSTTGVSTGNFINKAFSHRLISKTVFGPPQKVIPTGLFFLYRNCYTFCQRWYTTKIHYTWEGEYSIEERCRGVHSVQGQRKALQQQHPQRKRR